MKITIKMFKIYVMILFTCFTFKLSNSEGVCGDGWDLFHDDYYDICYQYHSGVAQYQDTVKFCKSIQESSLPTINSKSEQDFLTNMIVKYKMVDGIWLDASIKNKHIVWTDRSSGKYENWMSGRPVNESNCVEMLADEANRGKWADEPCTKMNGYICKRVVLWSDQETERLIRDTRRLLDEVKQNQNEHQAEIAQLKNNQVPIGFIYVQLTGQAEPKTLWPANTWSDVTATYAGQFFRAEGGGSLPFNGGVQAENAPRFTSKQRKDGGDTWEYSLDMKPGVWTEWMYSGTAISGGTGIFNRYLISSGEVRPINQAIRIFKRTK